MHIKMAGGLLAAALLSLGAGCQGAGDGAQPEAPTGTQEAKAESQCVERFEGIQNCALGNAQLAETEEGLSVSGLEDPKTDGVSSNFDGAVRWTQEASIQFADGQGQFALAARDGDQVVSTLRVNRGSEGQIALAPNFTGGSPTGATYRVNVYQDSRLVATTTSNPDRYIIIWWWDWWWWIHWDFFLYRSASGVNDGACVWRMRAGEGTFTAMVDGREVTGDSIEFVEEIQDGAYPYTSFSGIDIQGSAESYSILGESSSRE